jgi:hypothetical protein
MSGGWTYTKNTIPYCPECGKNDMLIGVHGAYHCERCGIYASDYVEHLRSRLVEMEEENLRLRDYTKHHAKYINSKSFLVDADDDGRHFIAWRNPDGTIISVEIIPGDWPWITACTETDMKTWVETITWHEWIKGGIKDDELKEMVAAMPEPEEEVT